MFLRDLANFIFSYDYSYVGCEDISIVKVAFLDYFGVTYRGFRERSSQIAFRSLNEIFGGVSDFSLKSSVVGCSDCECSVLIAGLVNGVSAHVLELDDGHRLAHMHLGSVIFSTALPLAEALDVSGKDFLMAVILGYKVGILWGGFVNPDHRNNGFHTTGTVGTLVAGVVASKLLNLDVDRVVNALGLCVTQSSGLLESDHGGSMAKTLHVGKAVQTAIMSVFLAKNGFTGSQTIIEGDEGFLNTMVFPNDSIDCDDLNRIFRNIDDIKLRDIYFKKYPFCRHLHSALDTILKLRNSILQKITHIECLIVKTYNIASKHNNCNINNREELKQSMPYAIAIALVCGDVDIDTVDKLISQGLFKKDSDVDKIHLIKNLVNKIIIVCDEKLNSLYPDKRPASISVKLVEGDVFSDYTLVAKGDIQNPLEISEIVDKFKKLNPDYDILKFRLVGNIEDYNMRYVVDKIK